MSKKDTAIKIILVDLNFLLAISLMFQVQEKIPCHSITRISPLQSIYVYLLYSLIQMYIKTKYKKLISRESVMLSESWNFCD